jgi:predicted phosphate transport protein (TIGR00153 family)
MDRPAHFVPETRERRNLLRALARALRPRDRRFFPLFDQHVALAVDALHTLCRLLAAGGEAAGAGHVRDIEALEKRADGVMDEVQDGLRRTLFPPFARALVLGLSNSIDDVLDLTEDAAESLHLYHVTRVPPEAIRLAELAHDSALRLQTAVGLLARLDRPREVLTLCQEVDALEAQADHLMRAAMSKLFREEPDAHQLVKLKAVYEVLESLTDKCKDVSNEIEEIVLRYG